MNNPLFQLITITKKELSDTLRTRLLLVITSFMLIAGAVALVTAALDLSSQVTDYANAKALLLSMGKSANELIAPNFQPLLLLRGFIEYAEIIGAILGIVLGHRSANYEKRCGTLTLIMTRPINKATLLLGKALANLIICALVIGAMFLFGSIGIWQIGQLPLTSDEILRIITVFIVATSYVFCFYLLGFILALFIKRSSHAILIALSLWLTFTLITPQIGDTLDPDNQIGAGVFRTLGIAKPQEKQIMLAFSNYETVRDFIEQSSPAKHFERVSFAITGIKSTYADYSLSAVIHEKTHDIFWLLALLTGLMSTLMLAPLTAQHLRDEQP
jgi:ABC-type transport system involved in multi-copper enzyme maturation permease subunit